MDNSNTVVIFSEDPLSSDALKFALESKSLDVRTFEDLREGLKFVILHPPTLIVLDYIKSGIKPGDIVAGIRKKLKNFPTPFLFILEPNESTHKIKSFDPKIDGFINRPHSLDHFLEICFFLMKMELESKQKKAEKNAPPQGKKGKKVVYDPELMAFVSKDVEDKTQPDLRPNHLREKVLHIDHDDKAKTEWIDDLTPLDESSTREHISLIGGDELEVPDGQSYELISPEDQSSGSQMKGTILVIDDEPFIIRILKTILEAENYRVLTADNGLEGMKKCKEIIPDLILLDVMMPELDGYEFAEIIRAEKGFQDIPIIMLSARSLSQDQGKSFKLGVNFYMQKPVDKEKLLSIISNLLPNE